MSLIPLNPSNKSYSCYISNHLPAKKKVDMKVIYFLTHFSLIILIKIHLKKVTLTPASMKMTSCMDIVSVNIRC